jgi:hypothetical protein
MCKGDLQFKYIKSNGFQALQDCDFVMTWEQMAKNLLSPIMWGQRVCVCILKASYGLKTECVPPGALLEYAFNR